jgi:soluble lytic murein transglycosylase-like protein
LIWINDMLEGVDSGHKVARVRGHKAPSPNNNGDEVMRSVCHRFSFALLIVAALSTTSAMAQARSKNIDGNGNGLDALISKHAAAHNVPEALVRRVIHRESRGNPRVISKGNYGLMQIRLGTARAMGYRGTAAGLLDADTNMTYAVRYLAGAYQAAGGNVDRAVRYYAGGYYYVAKRKGLPMPTAQTAAALSPGKEAAIAANAEATVAEAAVEPEPGPSEVRADRVETGDAAVISSH